MKTYILISVLICSLNNITFSQNTLQYYISKAEINSPLLQKQNNNNKIIDLDFKKYDAIYKSAKININSSIIFSPVLSRDGSENKFKLFTSGNSDYLGYDLASTDGGQYQSIISAEQPLFTKKYYKTNKTHYKLQRAENKNAVLLTKAELKQTVTHQYILCVQSEKQKENIQKNIQIIEYQIEQMKLLVKEGIYKITDLKLLEIELEDNQIKEEQLKSTYIENFNTMNLLCGIKDTAIYKINTLNLKLQPQNIDISLFSRQFKLDSLSLKNEQNISDLQYLPKVSLLGDAGLNATYRPTPDRLGFSFGVSLKWNIFDGHQKKYDQEKNQLFLSNIAIDQKNFELHNNIKKMNILQQINNSERQITLIKKQLSEYDELLELYKTEIKKGLISVLEIRILINEISSKKEIYINTLMAKEILINSYNYWNL
ncbi:MAG: TolC family protein [Prolixibacteraceae bacterium]|nr:TolC family protein [Prolixibacteraceae bacterium]